MAEGKREPLLYKRSAVRKIIAERDIATRRLEETLSALVGVQRGLTAFPNMRYPGALDQPDGPDA